MLQSEDAGENDEGAMVDGDADGGQGGEIGEDEVLDMAQRLAQVRLQTTATRGEMKATRERVLEYLLATKQRELTIGAVRFTVQEKPEPLKIADLYAETLRRHYGFTAPDIDQLTDLVAETKEELSKPRPVLSIRTVRRKSARKSSAGETLSLQNSASAHATAAQVNREAGSASNVSNGDVSNVSDSVVAESFSGANAIDPLAVVAGSFAWNANGVGAAEAAPVTMLQAAGYANAWASDFKGAAAQNGFENNGGVRNGFAGVENRLGDVESRLGGAPSRMPRRAADAAGPSVVDAKQLVERKQQPIQSNQGAHNGVAPPRQSVAIPTRQTRVIVPTFNERDLRTGASAAGRSADGKAIRQTDAKSMRADAKVAPHPIARPAVRSMPAAPGIAGGLYDETMDLAYASGAVPAPDAARDLFIGPLPRVIATLRQELQLPDTDMTPVQ